MTVTLNKHPSDDVDEGGNVIDNEPITENLSNLLIKLRNQRENGSTMNVDDYVIRVTVKVVKGDQSYSYTRKYKHTGIYSYYYTLDNENTRYSFNGAEGDTALKLTNMATGEERTVTKIMLLHYTCATAWIRIVRAFLHASTAMMSKEVALCKE